MFEKDIPYNRKKVNPIEVYAEVRSSPIHGLGLFAKKLIPKGIIWWHARPQDVLIISRDQFLTLASSYKTTSVNFFFENVLTYSYYEKFLNALIFCLDNSKYVNHSYNANSGSSKDENGFCSMAIKDIPPGEEITEDYSKYTFCSWLKKYKEYFEPSCW